MTSSLLSQSRLRHDSENLIVNEWGLGSVLIEGHDMECLDSGWTRESLRCGVDSPAGCVEDLESERIIGFLEE